MIKHSYTTVSMPIFNAKINELKKKGVQVIWIYYSIEKKIIYVIGVKLPKILKFMT